jgi:threonylcarbamoyladenosine tRNA methylthiotransferase MtaB
VRFAVVNLGCRVNRVESDGIAAALQAAGHTFAPDCVDVVVVNTCTVTGEAEKKARKAVRHALRAHSHAAVVVTGCAASIDPDAFAAMDPRVRVAAKDAVVDVVLALGDGALHGQVGEGPGGGDADGVRGVGGGGGASFPPPSAPLRYGEGFPTRVGIKIQDGCDNACAYCIVPAARGASASRPLPECVDEARRLCAAGAREVVLTGIDLGSYRHDGTDLTGLLGALLLAVPEARVRISSIEPPSITPQLANLMVAADGHVCRYLHVPLQSGSAKVLREMARPYTADEFRALTDLLYQAMPDLSLSTDIIVGFPGETDEDFERTLDMVRACRFAKVHAFRYSRRAGTPAAARPDQVDAEVIARRARELRRVADEVRAREMRRRLGRSELVLVEQAGLGTTESYFPVRVAGGAERGSLIRCTLTDVDENGIFIA